MTYRPPHVTAIGDFNPLRSAPNQRPTAYCACGARLSRYRPVSTHRCWACLHPPKVEEQP